jgi:hypothetical protein
MKIEELGHDPTNAFSPFLLVVSIGPTLSRKRIEMGFAPANQYAKGEGLHAPCVAGWIV